MIIAIDFDGTCVKHEFPRVGGDIGAVPVLKELVHNGHKLILFTMRSDVTSPVSDDPNIHQEAGNYLTDALNWFKLNDIPLYGIQTNPSQKSWTTSPKAYADLYIDDAALLCPLKYDSYVDHTGHLKLSGRPYVDWVAVREVLVKVGIIK